MNQQSEQINDVMSALAKAQGQMDAAIKDSSNPHFKSKYADLASVWEACREALSNNGLAITQTLDFMNEKQVLITTLGHTSGQWIKSVIALPIQKPGPHELGSCLSYCRRYSLAAMVGVYQDDDDANKAQAPYNKPKKEEQKIIEEPIKERTEISSADWSIFESYVNDIDDQEYFAKLVKLLDVPTIHDIKPKDFDRVMRSIQKKAKEKEAVNESTSVA